MTTIRAIATVFSATTLLAPALPAKEPDHDIVQTLAQAVQEMMDALAVGDRAVWERYLADGSLYSDEEGRVLTKAELIEEVNPLPKGYVGSIKVGDPKALVQDDVVVLSHRDREELALFGQNLVTYYQMTNTWAKQSDGRWQIVSTQAMAIPSERTPARIDAADLDVYTGRYEIAPDVTYDITREGDRIYGQRAGRDKEELLSLYADVLYRKGVWRGEKVFERDAQGKVIRMLDRRDNNDLVWKKVK